MHKISESYICYGGEQLIAGRLFNSWHFAVLARIVAEDQRYCSALTYLVRCFQGNNSSDLGLVNISQWAIKEPVVLRDDQPLHDA